MKFKFAKVRVDVVKAYAPCDDKSVDLKERFFSILNGVIERISRSYRAIVMKDINGRVGNGPQNDVLCAFGVLEFLKGGGEAITCELHAVLPALWYSGLFYLSGKGGFSSLSFVQKKISDDNP